MTPWLRLERALQHAEKGPDASSHRQPARRRSGGRNKPQGTMNGVRPEQQRWEMWCAAENETTVARGERCRRLRSLSICNGATRKARAIRRCATTATAELRVVVEMHVHVPPLPRSSRYPASCV